MKKGFELGGKYANDPINSEGKSLSQRKHRHDGPSLTPSEKFLKDSLMKQFCKLESGVEDMPAYLAAECWCVCGRLKSVGNICRRCAERLADSAN